MLAIGISYIPWELFSMSFDPLCLEIPPPGQYRGRL